MAKWPREQNRLYPGAASDMARLTVALATARLTVALVPRQSDAAHGTLDDGAVYGTSDGGVELTDLLDGHADGAGDRGELRAAGADGQDGPDAAGQVSGVRFGTAGQATGAPPSVVLKGGRVPQPGTHGRPVCGFRPSLQPELSPDGLHGFLVGGGQDVALPHSKLMLKKLSVRHQHCLVPFA